MITQRFILLAACLTRIHSHFWVLLFFLRNNLLLLVALSSHKDNQEEKSSRAAAEKKEIEARVEFPALQAHNTISARQLFFRILLEAVNWNSVMYEAFPTHTLEKYKERNLYTIKSIDSYSLCPFLNWHPIHQLLVSYPLFSDLFLWFFRSQQISHPNIFRGVFYMPNVVGLFENKQKERKSEKKNT